MADDKTLEIVGLVVNLIFPGLGTVIAATKRKEYMTQGIIQLVLEIIAIPLMFLIIGFLIAPAVWIWALITSIMMLTKEPAPAQKK